MGVTGFVLAGGASSRMGRDKAQLPVGRQTLLERVLRRLRPHVDRLVVVGRPNQVDAFRRLPSVEEIVVDAEPGQGPLMGIYTGLTHTQTPLNLFVPCDMPWIAGALIERLLQASLEGAKIVASLELGKGIQPFPLVCRREVRRAVGELLDRRQRSLQELLRLPGVHWVQVEEPTLRRSFTNVNTVSDYAELCHENEITFASGS